MGPFNPFKGLRCYTEVSTERFYYKVSVLHLHLDFIPRSAKAIESTD